MLEIQYVGEHLLPGKIGHFAIVLSFVAAILAAAAYLFANKFRETETAASWKGIGRTAFAVHGLSIFTIIGLIFYVMVQQYYEYYYVFNHVNEDLPFQYIFSAFWEGQEGSFLLWMFWHIVLGTVLIFTAKKWEAPTMGVLALVEVFLASMILGIYLGSGEEAMRLGSNPLVLLRDALDAPIFSDANYLEKIKGTGLNPLLQNYWMTIHPPTLFLGFASTVVPFCFAMAGLLTNDHKGWLKPVLPWALFSGAILGTGILMGGAWAYEALSFGGYWAWDPVENMSLVPWLTLLAGLHTNLIARNTGYSIRSTYFFYALTFILILYSTFLTRSGVLGDTSVHAFTEMGLEAQLISFILFFTLLAYVPFFAKYKQIPAPKKEEALSSKEFWIFIGSLILLFSAVMITASTSLPVYNKIIQVFNPAYEGRVITDPVDHYNKYQLWIGIFIGLMTGTIQYLRWKEQNWSKNLPKFALNTGISIIVAGVLTGLTMLWIKTYAWQYTVLLFSGYYAAVANAAYIFTVLKGNWKSASSAIAHMGFGLMIVGVIASGLNQFHISSNPFAQRGLISEERLGKNIMLFKGMPMYMSGYRVTYVDDFFEGNNRKYQVRFEELNEEGQIQNAFEVFPTALYDNKLTKVAAYNPSTKHYLGRDIFTHIASIATSEADMEFAREQEDSLKYRPYPIRPAGETIIYDTVAIRDTVVVRKYFLRLDEVIKDVKEHPDYIRQDGDIAVGVRVLLQDEKRDSTFVAEPISVLRGPYLYAFPVHVQDLALKLRVNEQLFLQLFPPETNLNYQPFRIKQGGAFEYEGYEVRLTQIAREIDHPLYVPQEGDIAVSAVLNIQKDGKTYQAAPVFLIRDNQYNNLKAEIPELGLHFRFSNLDPTSEMMEILAASSEPISEEVPVDVAYAPRTDFLVLESIVFPGINFFWAGSILMMTGLLMGMFYRMARR